MPILSFKFYILLYLYFIKRYQIKPEFTGSQRLRIAVVSTASSIFLEALELSDFDDLSTLISILLQNLLYSHKIFVSILAQAYDATNRFILCSPDYQHQLAIVYLFRNPRNVFHICQYVQVQPRRSYPASVTLVLLISSNLVWCLLAPLSIFASFLYLSCGLTSFYFRAFCYYLRHLL